jgi:hypothetical protein
LINKGIGFIVVVRLATLNLGGPVSDVLLPILYGITGFLNVLITVCIIILILRYRRVTAKLEAPGRNQSSSCLNLMMVLIESAGLVVVIDAFVVAGYTSIQSGWGNIAGQVWIPMQVSFKISLTGVLKSNLGVLI